MLSGPRRPFTRHESERAKRADDPRRFAAREAVEEQSPLAEAHAERWGAIVMRGAAAHPASALPLAAEALDDLPAMRLERREVDRTV